ncbi:MAG: UDP-N-acetylmuramate--L-alanine ligase [Nitrospinota bacterium]|nr:UDP-N-acetylmuramate--L-alanine ligase [Nitrospinota bacterium]
MFLGKTKRIHFIGIGGSGMSGIAEVLINLGYEVSGSDQAQSPATDHLEKVGAKIRYQHRPENVQNAQVVVTSTAVKPDNTELLSAREKMIPVIPRAEMLAELMRMKYGIAIAGTHGKTTTTSLVATVLGRGQLDPTVVIGGRLKSIGSNAKLGQSEFLVAEADESDGSFLHLAPTIAIVTTLDEEHLDFYKTFDKMKEVFLTFLNRLPFYGTAILCLDEPHIQALIPSLGKRYITYGLTRQADYSATDFKNDGLKTRFDVYFRGKKLGEIQSCIPGQHNVCNILAAIVVGSELDLDFNVIKEALKDFPGVQRRFEIMIESDSFILVDDYGHHPAEIKATLKAAKEVWPARRLTVVFQPHRYTRTQLLMEQFWPAFNDADAMIVTPIYSAGEDPIGDVHARQIAEGAKHYGHKNVSYMENKNEIISHILRTVKPGDVLMTLGAGDIGELSHELMAKLPASLNPLGEEN